MEAKAPLPFVVGFVFLVHKVPDVPKDFSHVLAPCGGLNHGIFPLSKIWFGCTVIVQEQRLTAPPRLNLHSISIQTSNNR